MLQTKGLIVASEGSAKPLCVGSIPTRASNPPDIPGHNEPNAVPSNNCRPSFSLSPTNRKSEKRLKHFDPVTCPGVPWTTLRRTAALSFVIPRACDFLFSTLKTRLLYLLNPGRVPHVCAGISGALHGLNEMGRSPFPLFSFACSERVFASWKSNNGQQPSTPPQNRHPKSL